ncbi:hypothetical protein AB1Y20_019452 [Prymnesium parvum]|uniref:PX domain-containing protein n=1 Tax=Prymnesium parvum TaxID=97485 RepID=A0AB34JUI0_PRYPA
MSTPPDRTAADGDNSMPRGRIVAEGEHSTAPEPASTHNSSSPDKVVPNALSGSGAPATGLAATPDGANYDEALSNSRLSSAGTHHASEPHCCAKEGSQAEVVLRPHDVQGLLITGTNVVRHLRERDFGQYQLHVPRLPGEHEVFRRFSEFVALNDKLMQLETPPQKALRVSRCGLTDWPSLPPKTSYWQDATSSAIIARRWAALQHYLDQVLHIVLVNWENGHTAMWRVVHSFLSLDKLGDTSTDFHSDVPRTRSS